MSEEVLVEGVKYRLRAGAPMNKGSQGGGDFVIHTFMAECSKVDMIQYTENISSSTDFRGQGGELVAASFKRLSTNTGVGFSGTREYSPDYVDENIINGCS